MNKQHATLITVYVQILRMSFFENFSMVLESSRSLAFGATLEVLDCQKVLFDFLFHEIFCLDLHTLDATILIGAICIMYSCKNRDDLTDSLQQFEWVMGRLDVMGVQNAMTKAILGDTQRRVCPFKESSHASSKYSALHWVLFVSMSQSWNFDRLTINNQFTSQ